PSAMAATLLVPAVWVLARYFVRQAVLPATSPVWAALLTAVNPFFLWYGQEARPYALWALLAMISTYLLLRCVETAQPIRALLAGYGVVLLLFLATHYYAVLLMPVHAVVLYRWLAGRSRRVAAGVGLALLTVGALIGVFAAWTIFSQGGGGNFPSISLAMLIPDLVNAFSLGLSVDLDDVRWLDWVYGLVTLLGIGWTLRSRSAWGRGGWLLPLMLLLPIALILLINTIQPAYMNSRHLSLLAGVYLILLGGGLGVVWQWQKIVALGLVLLLLAGAGYSTRNYFTLQKYDKDHYTAMGEVLTENLLPGDLLLISPPFSWRIFDYYLPIAEIEAARQAGVKIGYFGAPLIYRSWDDTFAQLAVFQTQYRRIWLARSGTHPYLDPQGQVSSWLLQHTARRLRVEKFYSPNAFLDLELYLSQPPVFEGLQPPAQHKVAATFGDQILLVGYDIGQPLVAGSAIPITLYWQVTTKPQDHYKYILQLVETTADGQTHILAITEREPFSGEIPTEFWDPGKTIIEPIELLPTVALDRQQPQRYQLSLQLYHEETLKKLSLTQTQNANVAADGQTLLFPYLPP
ncbi:MAG: hypothetical protein M3Q45_10860, partial [Chloroflexota bacterium]|nr:hypothetical protein [Chloroflexota bacterium]